MSNPTELPDLAEAVRKLVKAKGRFHTAQNYAEVVEALARYDARRAQPESEAPQAVPVLFARKIDLDDPKWVAKHGALVFGQKQDEGGAGGWIVPLYLAAQQAAAPGHETIVSEGSDLVCTACGTSAPGTPEAPAEDPVVEANRQLLLERSRVGLVKYGKPLEATSLSHAELTQHALEEALDLANYLQAILRKQRAAQLDGAQEGSESNG